MFAAHSMLLPDYDIDKMLHPNGAVLDVDAGVAAIVICECDSTMLRSLVLKSISLISAKCFVVQGEIKARWITPSICTEERWRYLTSISLKSQTIATTVNALFRKRLQVMKQGKH